MADNFVNFYELIDELDIELTRKENLDSLRKAESKWSKRVGREAEGKQRLIQDARKIFRDQTTYEKYHQNLVRYSRDKLEGLVNVAVSDDKILTTKKKKEIINHGEQELCFSEKEIEAVLDDLLGEKNITVVEESALSNVTEFVNWLSEKAVKGVEIVEERLEKVGWFQDFTGSYRLLFGLVGLAFFTLVVGITVGPVTGFFILLCIAGSYLLYKRRR